MKKKPPVTSFITIIERMQQAAAVGDREIAHATADDVLVQAVRYLASHRVNAGLAENLIMTYEKVKKYYA